MYKTPFQILYGSIYVIVITWPRGICLIYTPKPEHIYQANPKCPCYNQYIPLYKVHNIQDKVWNSQSQLYILYLLGYRFICAMIVERRYNSRYCQKRNIMWNVWMWILKHNLHYWHVTMTMGYIKVYPCDNHGNGIYLNISLM